ncbi:MAG TPA: signal peptidase I [Stellaceae bacterium]|nr:signal peptidase I [Stellaceae bacterium]
MELIKTVVYAVLIAIVVRTVAYEPFNIPSPSMVPTLLVGDYLFVSKFAYGYSRYSLPFGLPLFSGRILFHSPHQGDVVVFKLPSDTSKDFIKRLIGLPGDRVQVTAGELYVNGKEVPRVKVKDEQCPDNLAIVCTLYTETLPDGVQHPILKRAGYEQTGPNNTPVYTVPPNHYFMMGDNRDNSDDSRGVVGYVPAENLVGPAEFLFYSFCSADSPIPNDPTCNGYAHWWEVWKWPFAIRYDRLFRGVH